jgi:hypothetical protein
VLGRLLAPASGSDRCIRAVGPQIANGARARQIDGYLKLDECPITMTSDVATEEVPERREPDLLLTVADQHILGSVEHPIGTVGGRTLSATA